MNDLNQHVWKIDRRLSISTLITGLSSLIMAVALITTLAARIDHLERTTRNLDTEIRSLRTIAISMARMEERIDSFYKTLSEIRNELRHVSPFTQKQSHQTKRLEPVEASQH